MNTSPAVIALGTRIEATVAAAIRRALPGTEPIDPLVRRGERTDFQANAALALARSAGRPPRELAAAITAEITPDGPIETAEVSGPAFVNLTLADAELWRQTALRLDAGLGLPAPYAGTVTVVDYSAPNVAKRMHVGHLRSTVIGDTLVKLLESLGGTVIRQNHIGDWGTQFGMLIQYLDEHPGTAWHGTADIAVLDGLYRSAAAHFAADAAFADRARSRVVALQAGDEATLAVWRDLVAVSLAAFNKIYRRLDVSLSDVDLDGESVYNPHLDDVVAELTDAGIAVESQGALCVFDERFTGPEGNPIPLILRKSDGGYGYATTDMATLRHRVRELKATRMLYLTDARQALHFAQVFAAGRRAGWIDASHEVVHVPFGTVLGADGRPFKTRSGDTVALTGLLDAAVAGARAVVAAKNPDLDGAALDRIAASTGIGAVKYADLSTARTTDYRFDIERMVSLNGDTGVYLQYAHARLASILRKAGEGETIVDEKAPVNTSERALVLRLDEYAAVLAEAAALNEPHRIATYLFGLAKVFSSFFDRSPVLKAETAALRGNRLALVRLTRLTLHHGLSLLGIDAPERM
ncbi:arginine--tRNA ligase [Phytomonospora endophytica]|uniref:Arginine--tRNA ligase n=1 Tax=Phytomonospora endophytica TaxID=714109 RepID=A0A841FLD8_9ACTN|nr:arginine--tRNA ligase [Phytomonospora endophytica]MBB6034362.1 arginyl-tRNA synthetase [Phytomonospora endophytica]GIG66755.1 arginine--tRNA ligase [Phytomonospora endophytica]